jgi:hypothetical protein
MAGRKRKVEKKVESTTCAVAKAVGNVALGTAKLAGKVALGTAKVAAYAVATPFILVGMAAEAEAKQAKKKKREWTGKTPAFPGQIVGGGSPGLGKRS